MIRDTQALAALHAACFGAVAWGVREMAEMLSTPGTQLWIAGPETAPSAMLVVRTDGESADILTLATHPQHRRLGLAAQLLRQAAEALREAGNRRIVLEVSAENIAARALYDRLDYREVALRKAYYPRLGGAEDAWVMERLL